MQNSKQMSESFILAIFLTLSGGFMDAYSYICRGEVFANAQTGNILLLGVNLSVGNWSDAARYLFPIFAFMSGIAMAEIIQHKYKYCSKVHWRQIIVIAEAVILLSVSFIPQSLNLLANSLTSLACGAQVESFRKIEGYGAATTMCIGNLRTATQALFNNFFHRDRGAVCKSMMFYGIIVIFTCGAVIGNFCVKFFAEKAIMGCSILLLAGFAVMCVNNNDKVI